MANTTIPNLPSVIALSGTEVLEIVQSGTSSKATVAQIAAFPQQTPIVFPSYTTTQKLALSGLTAGSVVFDSTLGKLSLFTGGGWQTIVST
jgi:hypothetical protein